MKLLFENWRKFLNEQRIFKPKRAGLYLFDFDDTLAVTSCTPSEEGGEITYDEFCHLGEEEKFDYLPEINSFKSVIDGVMKQGSYMENEVAILTARQPQIEVPIKNKFETEQGIPAASYKVYGVEGGAGPKARKVAELLDTGKYDFVYFVDDLQTNLDAVGLVVDSYGIEYQPVLVAHEGSDETPI